MGLNRRGMRRSVTDAESHTKRLLNTFRSLGVNRVMRLFTLMLFVSVTSCAVRVGTPLRPASTSPPARTLGKRSLPRVARTGAPTLASASNDGSVAQLCVDEINRYRSSLGLSPLQRAADREACANGQIADDARSGKWHGSFGGCGEALQNECMSSPASREDMIKGCLRGMWNEGPGGGHYEAMKSSTKTVWCGFYTTPSGDVWSVQDFR
jgi:hypothetical protein